MAEKTKKKFTKEELVRVFVSLVICGVLGMIGNFVGYEHCMPLESLPGMIILVIIAVVGWSLSTVVMTNFPAFVHVSILGILATMPWNPLSATIAGYVGKIQLMAVVTPILAYSGLTVGHDWHAFVKVGWKAILVGILVIFGTFFWSALIAEVLLKVQGTI
ncbi:MAG: hypothetical protein HFG41_08365 [Coprococcus sp.]|nr:hypothetical protein [Coprococcus sp.]